MIPELMMAVLLQCYATRTQSGCQPMGWYQSAGECQQIAVAWRREDTRALRITGLPVVVSYRCQPLPQPKPEPEPALSHACQRLQQEQQKCDLGKRTCDQHRIEYWRKRCIPAE